MTVCCGSEGNQLGTGNCQLGETQEKSYEVGGKEISHMFYKDDLKTYVKNDTQKERIIQNEMICKGCSCTCLFSNFLCVF